MNGMHVKSHHMHCGSAINYPNLQSMKILKILVQDALVLWDKLMYELQFTAPE